MIEIIGIFLIGMGILFDDILTLILFSKGFGILETNPIYLKYGGLIYVCVSIVLYAFIIMAWIYVIKTYNKLYAKKGIGYKIYDIFVFMFCVFIVFFASTKAELGYNNLNSLISYWDKDTRPMVQEIIQDGNEQLQSNPVEYKKNQQMAYDAGIRYNIDYFRMLLILLFGYLLFRVGYKVSPYECG